MLSGSISSLMADLPDPEQAWERPLALRRLERAEVEARIGATDQPLELLGGGLANTNVRVGADRVLRLYRREPAAAALEAALLSRPWRGFRVPAVLERGDDFLLLEYVPHTAVQAGPAQGAAVGRALAEIHALSFSTGGLLNPSLRVTEIFDDLVDALRAHLVAQIEAAAAQLGELDGAVLETFDRRADSLRSCLGQPVLVHGDFKPSNLRWSAAGELLVLDWEFAYAGAALSDVGQLLRWRPPPAFVDAFAGGYRGAGGRLPAGWPELAAVCDLVNLAGLLTRAEPGSRRSRDVLARIRDTLR